MAKENKIKGNVPNLRFPGFNRDWESNRLADICNINPKNGSLPNSFVYIDLESVENGQLLKEDIVSKDDAPSRAQRVLSKRDILFQMVRPYQKNNLFFNKEGEYVASTGYAQIRTEQNSQFIFQYLHTQKFVDNVIERCTGTSYPAINSTDLGNITIVYPSLEEQQKISSFLSLIDKRIDTQNKIIEQLETLIKGLYQKLILRQIPNKKLNDCVSCHSSSLTESDVIDKNGVYPVYGATGIIAFTENYQINEDAVLIIKDGSGVGKVQYGTDKFSIIGTLNYLNAKSKINLRYIFFCLKFFNFEKYKVGSGIPHIYFKDYGEAFIYCPSLEEQIKIESLLSSIDEKINIEKKLLQKYEIQKKYLLQNLFI